MLMGRARGSRQATAATSRSSAGFISVFGERRGSNRHEFSGNDALHCEVDEDGVRRYYLYAGGPPHRENGPAVIYLSGGCEYYLFGMLHRTDGPAVIYAEGRPIIEEWYANGQLHRMDGPARINRNGSREWFCDGKRHREGGPAVEYADGQPDSYYTHGKLDTGPQQRTSFAGPRLA